jgi:hypothetical protein
MTIPTWLAACLLGWSTSAYAKDAKIYVNGERADGLRDVVLESVDVRIDEKGNLWITAPQYRVGGTEGEAATEAAPAGAWWLVVEDNGSTGLTIEVRINGRLATTVKSGQGGGLLDVGPWMHRGANQVVLRSEAAPASDGGPLVVKLGPGAGGGALSSVSASFARDPGTAKKALEKAFVIRVP